MFPEPPVRDRLSEDAARFTVVKQASVCLARQDSVAAHLRSAVPVAPHRLYETAEWYNLCLRAAHPMFATSAAGSEPGKRDVSVCVCNQKGRRRSSIRAGIQAATQRERREGSSGRQGGHALAATMAVSAAAVCLARRQPGPR